MGKDVMGTLNDPADLFATDAHAEANPEVYDRRDTHVTPDAVAVGERNAVVNAARKKSMLSNLARARRRSKRAGQRRGGQR